jgi:hypothetical protein
MNMQLLVMSKHIFQDLTQASWIWGVHYCGVLQLKLKMGCLGNQFLYNDSRRTATHLIQVLVTPPNAFSTRKSISGVTLLFCTPTL